MFSFWYCNCYVVMEIFIWKLCWWWWLNWAETSTKYAVLTTIKYHFESRVFSSPFPPPLYTFIYICYHLHMQQIICGTFGYRFEHAKAELNKFREVAPIQPIKAVWQIRSHYATPKENNFEKLSSFWKSSNCMNGITWK